MESRIFLFDRDLSLGVSFTQQTKRGSRRFRFLIFSKDYQCGVEDRFDCIEIYRAVSNDARDFNIEAPAKFRRRPYLYI